MPLNNWRLVWACCGNRLRLPEGWVLHSPCAAAFEAFICRCTYLIACGCVCFWHVVVQGSNQVVLSWLWQYISVQVAPGLPRVPECFKLKSPMHRCLCGNTGST